MSHPDYPQVDSGFSILVFTQDTNPIDAINHLTSLIAYYINRPTMNNQLRTSSNPRKQATMMEGLVTIQLIHGRPTSLAVGTSKTFTPASNDGNSGKQHTVIYYNCKGEGHMAT